MFWDYRVISRNIGFNRALYEIHRVFYEDEAKTVIAFIETQPLTLAGASAEVMLEDIEMALDGMHRPTLTVYEK